MDAATAEQEGDAVGAELRRPIGEIFVEFGFITREQLEAALVVQRQTGARIGEILVEQGSLTRLDLASALAENWEPRRPAPDAGVLSPGNPSPSPAPAQPGWSGHDHAASAELELRSRTAGERLAAVPSGRRRRRLLRRAGKAESALQKQIDDLADRFAAVEDLEHRLSEVGKLRVGDALATGARLSTAEATLEGLEARVRQALDGDLGGHSGTVAARLDRIEHGLDGVALLDERLTTLEALVERHEARLAGQISEAEEEGYVAFAPTVEGYRLVERDGTPPELGTTVDVEGCDGRLVVTRYGRSPLPLDERPCAYLDRV